MYVRILFREEIEFFLVEIVFDGYDFLCLL